jgi:hypothetical protein
MDDDKTYACGQSIEEHIEALLEAMRRFDIGGGCEGTYRALLEMAALAKEHNGFPDYVPRGIAGKVIDPETVN